MKTGRTDVSAFTSTSATATPDTRHAASPQTPSPEAPRSPKSGISGVLKNLPRLMRSAVTALTPGNGSSSRTSSPVPKLTRQRAFSPEKRKDLETQFPRGAQSAATTAQPPSTTLNFAEQVAAFREKRRLEQHAAASAPSSSAARASALTRKPANGIPLTSLDKKVQAAFLARYDPVKKLKLTDQTVFYRSTDKRWLITEGKKTMLAGNPESVAGINNYLMLRPNHMLTNEAILASMRPETRESLLADPSAKYLPTPMIATNLPDPTLNVMCGEAATTTGAYGGTSNHVLVKMTLGDLRKAGGGQVFYDTSAKAGGSTAQPLIVTLPKGALVPVELVGKP